MPTLNKEGKALDVLVVESKDKELRLAWEIADLEYDGYRDFYRHAPISYFTLNPHGRIMDANHAASSLMGLPHDQLITRQFEEFVARGNLGIFHQCIRDVFKHKGNYTEVPPN